MNDDETQKNLAEAIRSQLRQRDFKDALRSQYKLVHSNKTFKTLLDKLEGAGRQSSKESD